MLTAKGKQKRKKLCVMKRKQKKEKRIDNENLQIRKAKCIKKPNIYQRENQRKNEKDFVRYEEEIEKLNKLTMKTCK